MASWIERDQLQPVAPALPNTEAIARTFQTKLQYWAQGAAQVKSAYQNALGLELTREDNQGKLNSYMKTANSQLQSVTETDLSVGDNVQGAMNIFKPIYSDQNLMGDNAITKHYKNQLAIAESARTRDGGSEFSQTNLQSLQMSLNDFRSDPNSDSWRNHYATREYYTPYYDVSKEIADLKKTFVPSSNSFEGPIREPIGKDSTGKEITGPNDYMKKVVDKSSTAAQWRLYLETNLSDRAKKQLAINAKVAYNGDLGIIAADYADYSLNKAKSMDKQISEINGVMGSPSTSANEKKTLETQKQLILERKNAMLSEVDQIRAGNIGFLRQNANRLAATLYTGNYINNVAQGLARTDTTVQYSPNEVSLTYFKQEQENLRNNANLQNRMAIAQLESDTTLAAASLRASASSRTKGDRIQDVLVDQTQLPGEVVTNGLSRFETERASVDQQLNSTFTDLNNYLRAIGDSYPNVKGEQDIAQSKWWSDNLTRRQNGQSVDPKFNSLFDTFSTLKIKKETMDSTSKLVDDQIKVRFGDQYKKINSQISEIAKETGAPRSFLDQVTAAIFDGSFKNVTGGGDLFSPSGGVGLRYQINGQDIQIPQGGVKAIQRLQRLASGPAKDVLKARNDLYNENYLQLNTWQRPVDPDANLIKATRQSLANRIGLQEKNVGDIIWDGRGKVRFNIVSAGDKKVPDIEDLQVKYGANSKVVGSDENQYLEVNDINVFTTVSDDPKLRAIDDNLNVQLRANGQVGTSPASLWDPAGNGIFFRVRKTKIGDDQYIYTLIHQKQDGTEEAINRAPFYSLNDLKTEALNASRYIASLGKK